MSGDKGSFDADSTVISDHSVHSPSLGGQRPARLEQIRGPGAPREALLVAPETVVGRSAQVGLWVDSGLLSRRHAAFKRNGPEVRLQDLDSANGVYVNGVRVHAVVLCEGDTIQIGDAVFVFHEGS